MSVIKPPTVKNFIKSMYVCSTHGPSYMLDMRFLTPGRYFFNEELADKSVVIPEKVVRLSTRKRHALRGSEKGEGVDVSGKEGGEKKVNEKKKMNEKKKVGEKKGNEKKGGEKKVVNEKKVNEKTEKKSIPTKKPTQPPTEKPEEQVELPKEEIEAKPAEAVRIDSV